MSRKPSFGEALALWARVGVLSFGGPAGQIALMHRMVVEERKWLTENQFLNALNFSMLLPGPEAMQLATYAGWRLHGTRGGLVAGLLFVLPGAAVVLALAMIYGTFGTVPVVEALFFGVKAAVLVIVVEALLRIARRALKKRSHWLVAAASFIAIFFLDLPYPLIVLGAALAGFALSVGDAEPETARTVREPKDSATPLETVTTIVIWLAIWLVPLAMLFLTLGPSHVLPQAGLFFSKLAIVTFGGAYAVLAYMAQQAVEGFGWLSAGEMLDGLGLAETTPGPLILVTEFVGYLAAFRKAGEPALLMGLAGAIVTLWVTFAPCFLWIFAGAPYIERLGANAKLSGALTGVTAAVVGVILNLALWFALHVLFAKVEAVSHGPVRLWTPELATFDWQAALLSTLAVLLLLWRHSGIISVLGVCAALGLVMRFAL